MIKISSFFDMFVEMKARSSQTEANQTTAEETKLKQKVYSNVIRVPFWFISCLLGGEKDMTPIGIYPYIYLVFLKAPRICRQLLFSYASRELLHKCLYFMRLGFMFLGGFVYIIWEKSLCPWGFP